MMNWILHQTTSNVNSLPPIQFPIPQPPRPPPPPPPPPPQLSEESNLGNRISPSILLIIVILAVIFFISGLLHLLVRYLLRPTAREPDDSDNVTVLQGQLQQLFLLHDSGVDQSFIDTLPVFMYKAIIGLKDPFDCAVCLCEFEPDDKLRLLPKCSHAFHIECIDTWLLSHSTCPLCRSSLVPEFSPNNSCSPVVLVLESGSESSREIGVGSSHRGGYDANAHMGFLQEDDFGPPIAENSQKLGEVVGKEDSDSAPVADVSETKVVQVKLGKFRNVDASGNGVVGGGEGSSSSSNLDQRRCFSMGSYEYVMNETSFLQVAIMPSKKKPSRFKKAGHAMSECDCHSRREGFKGFDSSKSLDCGSAKISTGKRESFSVSKIWMRSKKDKPAASEDSSRRAFSFRLPLHRESAAAKAKCSLSPRTVSEFDADLDVEVGSCNNSMVSFGSQLEEAPSFARRTLLWIVGKQNKVGSHNLS